MSKIIKLTPEYITEIRKAFEEALKTAKLSDGKINFTKSFGSIKREATVFFTEVAWLKMQTLIREFDTEVAWHGIATRGENPDKDEYYISDILVYPQEVTGATVTTDQEKYQTWLMNHEDDVFNNIRMQGHSHVNMSTSPSSVDTALYDGILEQLEDDMFYIFMIWNKRGDKTIKIYDLAKNVMFDTSDCKVEIIDDGLGLDKFLMDAKTLVSHRTYVPTTTPKIGFDSYGSGSSSKKEDGKTQENNKRKGKRKGTKRGSMSNANEDSRLAIFDDDDEWSNPYESFGGRDWYY